MIETKTQLTTAEIDNIYQSMSAAELWQLNSGNTPIELNYTQEEIEKSEQIYTIMDETDLDYEDVEKILFEPKKASLGVIQTYCKTLNIDIVDFIEKALV
jgi:hypothetical protein